MKCSLGWKLTIISIFLPISRYSAWRTTAYCAAIFSCKATSFPVAFSMSAAPCTKALMSKPAQAMGSNPTGVSTEKRPPTLSGMTKLLYPSLSAHVRAAPFFASVMATITSLASSLPRCASHCFFNKRKVRAVSVVVPDLDMLMTPNFLSFK